MGEVYAYHVSIYIIYKLTGENLYVYSLGTLVWPCSSRNSNTLKNKNTGWGEKREEGVNNHYIQKKQTNKSLSQRIINKNKLTFLITHIPLHLRLISLNLTTLRFLNLTTTPTNHGMCIQCIVSTLPIRCQMLLIIIPAE